MKHGLVYFACWGLFTAVLHAQDITVKPAGLQAVWDTGKDDFDFSTYNQQSAGTGVALIISTAKGKIISLPNEQIQLTIGGAKATTFMGMGSAKTSEDGTKARVEVTAKGKVAVEAGVLPVEGKLTVITASQKAEVKSDPVKFTAGTVLKFPASAKLPDIKVESAGKPKWGDGGWEVSLSTNAELDGVAAFRFVDKAGKVVEGKRSGWSRSGMFGKVNVTLQLSLESPVEEGTLVLEVWTDQEKKEVPVSLKVGLTGAP